MCLVLHRLELPAHDVHLRVRDGEDVAVCVSEPEAVRSISSCTPSCVFTRRWPLAVAVQGGVRHGPQVDPEAELVASEILGQVHVGPAARVRFKVTGEFIPHVGATDALVVDPAGDAVDHDLHSCDVGVEIVLGIPGARRVGVDEQKEDALERPVLLVYPKGQSGVRAL